MNRTRIVVPSWAALRPDMQAETGSRYPAFIQLGGVPLYEHIVRVYAECHEEAEFIFVLANAAPELEPTRLHGCDVRVLRIDESHCIGDSVLQALTDLGAGQSVVIHMADTLLSSPLPICRDVVYAQLRSDLYRWTTIRKESDGSINVLHDRDHSQAGNEQAVCVGVFVFYSGELFKRCLSAAVAHPDGGKDPLFTALENYSKDRDIVILTPEYWYDCGHIDSYYETRLSFHNLRHFNTLTYDQVNGIVTKRSANLDAFRHQVRWFKQIPDDLSYFLPRVFDSNDGDHPYITMELLSIPTLSDLFVSGRLEVGAWNDVANKIRHVLQHFRKYSFASSISRQIAFEIYIGKTRTRIQQFREQRPEAFEFSVAGPEKNISLHDVLLSLSEYAEQSGLLELDSLAPIHGDLCFSNIMFDPRGRHIKLIDPRGEFGVPGIYGDPRYDKAKLLHSYAGGYDFIVSDRFSVSLSASGILDCTVHAGEYCDKVKQIFDATLFCDAHDQRQCEAIQALLFLSMLPLHSDKPDRQLAMLAIGLKLYGDNLRE